MRTTTLAGLALAIVATGAAAQTYTVDRVIIQGAKSVSADQLQQSLTMKPGSRVTRDDIVADQEHLSSALTQAHVTGRIKTAMRSKAGNHIDVIYMLTDTGIEQPQVIHKTVTVDAKLDHVYFQGNKKVSSDKLLAAAQMQPGTPVTEASLKDAAQRILAEYKAVTERTSVGIKANPTMVAGGKVDITWVITEKRVPVNTEDEGGQKMEQ